MLSSNVFFRSLKQECVWLHKCENFNQAKRAIDKWIKEYNPHLPIRERWRNPYRLHNLPFGKKLRKGRVVDYEQEQKVIRSILNMHGDRLSNTAIVRALTAMRIPTKQRGFKWHPEMVRQILLRHGND